MPELAPVLLVAAGGLARETLAVLARLDRPVVGILDDQPDLAGTTVGGVAVLGSVERVTDVLHEHPRSKVVLCAGKGRSRRAIAARLGGLGVGPECYATVVDPSVNVPAGCTIGAGSILLAGSVLTADVQIGSHVVMMPRVVLTHDNVVADYATLCAGVTLGGNVEVDSGAYLGMASSVRERCRVGADSVLGMGAVLLTDLPEGRTWAGVPARDLANPTTDDTESATVESTLPSIDLSTAVESAVS